MNIIQIN